jgi:hypothetical protein
MTKATACIARRPTASKIKALPTKQSTSRPAGPAADPIWALIEKHRRERAAYHKEIREKYREIDIPDGATDEMLAAGRLLFTTRPTTLLGVIGVLDYVGSQVDESDPDDATCPTYLPEEVDGKFWMHSFFDSIADALSSGMDKIVAVTGGGVAAP